MTIHYSLTTNLIGKLVHWLIGQLSCITSLFAFFILFLYLHLTSSCFILIGKLANWLIGKLNYLLLKGGKKGISTTSASTSLFLMAIFTLSPFSV